MNVQNCTPFPAVVWETADANRQWHITSLVRVKYVLRRAGGTDEWILRLTPEQGELFAGDVFYGDDIDRPVRYESDFVASKAHADIIVNAKTSSPDGKEQKEWQCGIEIISPAGQTLNRSQLKVCGPRQWMHHPKTGWTKSEPSAVAEVSLTYDHAYGGAIPSPDPQAQDPSLARHEQNPAGTGIKHKDMPADPHSAHQISWAEPQPENKTVPAGFGFIHRSWQPRIGHAGTYDQNWLDSQHPYPPQDFDLRHHQAANPELTLQGHLAPGTEIRLTCLLGKHPQAQFRIPELHCFSEHSADGEKRRHRMHIDTAIIDIGSEDETQWAVYLSYRHYAPIKDALGEVVLSYLPSELLAEQKQEQKKQLEQKQKEQQNEQQEQQQTTRNRQHGR